MENNKNKKSVKFQEGMFNFCDFIQVFVFTTNHHLKCIYILNVCAVCVKTQNCIKQGKEFEVVHSVETINTELNVVVDCFND